MLKSLCQGASSSVGFTKLGLNECMPKVIVYSVNMLVVQWHHTGHVITYRCLRPELEIDLVVYEEFTTSLVAH